MTNDILLGALVALQFLDAHSTMKILSQGGREMNPVMLFAFTLFGSAAAAFAVKGVAVSAIGYFLLYPEPPLVLGVVVLTYAAIVTNNYRQIK